MFKDFSLELRVARKKAGLTQHDVSHLLGIGQATISGVEHGRLMPTVMQLVKLSLIYGRSFECLYEQIVSTARQDLQGQIGTLPEEVRVRAATFNRTTTLNRLQQRLAEEIDEYDASA